MTEWCDEGVKLNREFLLLLTQPPQNDDDRQKCIDAENDWDDHWLKCEQCWKAETEQKR